MENRGIIPRHRSVQYLAVNPAVTAERGTQLLLQLFPVGVRSFGPRHARQEAMGPPHCDRQDNIVPCQEAGHIPPCHGGVTLLCQAAGHRSCPTTPSAGGRAVLCCISHAALLVRCHMSPLFPAPSCIPHVFCRIGMEQGLSEGSATCWQNLFERGLSL